MGKITGFVEFHRKKPPARPVHERLRDFREFEGKLGKDEIADQGARCMDCGIPFCHTGCPLGNLIPDWNDFVYRARWEQGATRLHSTNNFPEITGRVCPAPCEEACTLNIDKEPVAIKQIEREIADWALQNGHLEPRIAEVKTGKRVAVVGSGPAGLACAQQLARVGHSVTVFERDDRIGGLLRYGIPNFKMEKHLIDQRMEQMEAEGVTFAPNTNVGSSSYPVSRLKSKFDAIVLSGGATLPRDLKVPGRELDGVHFAMEFLTQQNRVCEGDSLSEQITAEDKHVIILGGGDTGSDCLGTSNRQGALSVQQFELMPEPPPERTADMPWPYWPMILRTSSSHEEGVTRHFGINTVELLGEGGKVKGLRAQRVRFEKDAEGRSKMLPVPGEEVTFKADLVLLAMGFLGPEKGPLLEGLGVKLTERGNVAVDQSYATSAKGVFSCGDMQRGQSLVVWAIWEGRECARGVDAYLMGRSDLLASPHVNPL